ncbi:MAG: class I SAM-dependent methyltransferase [Clostridia bacterium]|nr:class I SAM-dependent methyltransferase [Clostridia bacterium]
MNTVWSDHIQGIDTLFTSRALRFADCFAPQYLPLFALPDDKPIRILEIGCGPGALAAALRRHYPLAEIVGLDRDSAFVDYARAHVSGVTFVEGDATALPFPDGSFDVTISNTVAEHIEPSAFYGEQRRVLNEGGVCLVLSSRKGISAMPEEPSTAFENEFWSTVQKHDNTMKEHGVCQYPQNEMQMPVTMTEHGFERVTSGYIVADLTPDDPKYPPEMARAMLQSRRVGELDAIASTRHTMPEHISEAQIAQMLTLANARHDARLALYERGEKVWDTSVSIIMVLRGVKATENGGAPC